MARLKLVLNQMQAGDAVQALENLLDRYVGLVNSGDAGNWNPEKEQQVIDAREAINKAYAANPHVVKGEATEGHRVKKVGEEPGLCREYYIDEKGHFFAAQNEGPEGFFWYTTDSNGGEPECPVTGRHFKIVQKFATS